MCRIERATARTIKAEINYIKNNRLINIYLNTVYLGLREYLFSYCVELNSGIYNKCKI